MEKVILTAINARYTHTNLGLFYLKAVLAPLPYEVEILEFTLKDEMLTLLKGIYALRPDWLCISVYIWNSLRVKELLGEVKKILPQVKIVLGGPEVSYNPEDWLEQFAAVDRIITGGGERALFQLLAKPPEGGRDILSMENYPLGEIPFPYWNMEIDGSRYLYYESSRGCLFQCSYCLSSVSKKAMDFRPLTLVKEELARLAALKPLTVKFVDRTFNALPSHYRPIWEFLAALPGETSYHFELHPALLNEEDFRLLESVPPGRFRFEIGMQSLNESTLKSVNRTGDTEKSLLNIKRLIEAGRFRIHLDLIAGLPYEGMEEFKISFNRLLALRPHHLQVGFLKILPGTPLYFNAREHGLKYADSPPYHILETRELSFRDLMALKDFENAVDLLYNSGNFPTARRWVEDLFLSPFDCYFSLAPWFDHGTKDWTKLAVSLLEALKILAPGSEDSVLDALKWDWCRKASSHYYPPVLRDGFYENLKKAKQKIGERLRTEGIIPRELTPSEFNRSILFSPGTEIFREKEGLKKWNLVAGERGYYFDSWELS